MLSFLKFTPSKLTWLLQALELPHWLRASIHSFSGSSTWHSVWHRASAPQKFAKGSRVGKNSAPTGVLRPGSQGLVSTEAGRRLRQGWPEVTESSPSPCLAWREEGEAGDPWGSGVCQLPGGPGAVSASWWCPIDPPRGSLKTGGG